ncbi:MAG: S8 family serine peptidase [Methyloprofundus sp.]|nr:S8 family serine peptidase [Methyloprofundus sp.]
MTRLALSIALLASTSSFAAEQVTVSGIASVSSAQSSNTKLTLGLDAILEEYQLHRLAVINGVSEGNFSSQVTLAKVNTETVIIDAIALGNTEELKLALEQLGAEVLGAVGYVVSVKVPLDQLANLESLVSLKFARPVLAYTRSGAVTSQGDVAQYSDAARAAMGVGGAGAKIGVLSDSFNCSVNGSYTADQISGDLPAGVVVLEEFSGTCSDEGRAMAQIIHDVAPNAEILFHTAFHGEANFAQGILDLATAGADIIVDDVGYLAAPMFQDGIVAQAVDTVAAAGVAYFSSAGNLGRESYQSVFRSSGQTGAAGGVMHDFDPGIGVDTRLRIQQNSTTQYVLQWQDPYASVSGAPGASTDLNICVYAGGGLLGCLTRNSIGGDPVDIVTIESAGEIEISLEHSSGPNPGLVKFVAFGSISFLENYTGVNSSTLYGHANAVGANAVGASAFFNTPAFGVSPARLNSYSSAGGTPILFDLTGVAIEELRLKPEFTGPDGGNNTFFGTDSSADTDSFPNFFGTSASAPHIAGVAALMREVTPSLSPVEITHALKSTAVDIVQVNDGRNIGVGFDADSGAGLIDADAALAFVEPLVGDLDLDGCIGRNDVRILLNGIRSGSPDINWDFNGDGSVTRSDTRVLTASYTNARGVCP